MILDQVTATITIDTGKISNVIAIGFQPPHHRILGVEEIADSGIGATGAPNLRPIVTYFVSAPRRFAHVQAVPTIIIIGLPGRVRRLKEHIGVAAVVSNDKKNVTRPPVSVRTNFAK